jgi:hypothetical protein
MSHASPTAAAVAAAPAHKDRNLGRSRTTNDPAFLPKAPPSLFQQARRRRDLIDSFLAELAERGEDVGSPLVLMQVRTAAELVTAAEMQRALLLNGEATVNMHELLRLEGCASRAIARLGLRVEDRTGPPRGLERARQRWAQQQETSKTKAAAQAAGHRGKPSKQSRMRQPRDQTQSKTD